MKNYTLEELNKQHKNNPKILYSSEGIHGDQFEIFKLDDGSFAVYIWNDGYPNPMAGGGCAHLIPDSLIKNFSSKSFVSWLDLNEGFYFRPLLTDEEVMEFFKDVESILVIKMSTKQGEKIEFSYSGFMMYKPNRSSTSGYGSDDWFYLCTCQDKEYMLIFSDDAGYGTTWECFQLNECEYEKLKNAEINLWIETYFKKKDRQRIVGLHLENIDDVREILPSRSRCYEFSERHYYGMY